MLEITMYNYVILFVNSLVIYMEICFCIINNWSCIADLNFDIKTGD